MVSILTRLASTVMAALGGPWMAGLAMAGTLALWGSGIWVGQWIAEQEIARIERDLAQSRESCTLQLSEMTRKFDEASRQALAEQAAQLDAALSAAHAERRAAEERAAMSETLLEEVRRAPKSSAALLSPVARGYYVRLRDAQSRRGGEAAGHRAADGLSASGGAAAASRL